MKSFKIEILGGPVAREVTLEEGIRMVAERFSCQVAYLPYMGKEGGVFMKVCDLETVAVDDGEDGGKAIIVATAEPEEPKSWGCSLREQLHQQQEEAADEGANAPCREARDAAREVYRHLSAAREAAKKLG
jgi:hypothetical protein